MTNKIALVSFFTKPSASKTLFHNITSSHRSNIYINNFLSRTYSNNDSQKSFRVTPKEEKQQKKSTSILRVATNTSVWDAPLHAVDPSSYVRPSKRKNGAIFGATLFLFVVGLYVFSLYSLGQENFEDVRLPQETLRKLEQNKSNE